MGQQEHRAIAREDVAFASPTAVHPTDAVATRLDDVMDRYARGDDGALDELYRQGAPRLRGFLARLSGSLVLADDLTQDAFLRIASARGSFVENAPALPWMLAIARNALRDHLRREQVRRAHGATVIRIESGSLDPFASSETEGAAIARQTLGTVQEALMGLPERQREAFVLIRFEGLNIAQAAEVLGATPGAVKILAFRAYKAIREALDQQEGGQ